MKRALDFEQGAYDDTAKNWYDFRFEHSDDRYFSSFSAWCHGAAGIALAEIGLERIGLDAEESRIIPALDLAAKTQSQSQSLSLCCGPAALFEVRRLANKNMINLSIDGNNRDMMGMEAANIPSLFRSPNGMLILAALSSQWPDAPSMLLFE